MSRSWRTSALALGTIAAATAVIWFFSTDRVELAAARAPRSGRSAESAVPVVTERLIAVPMLPAAALPSTVEPTERGSRESDAKSYEEALFDQQQKFEAIPRASILEQRNQQALRAIFERLDFAVGFAQSGLECRGTSCRGVFQFRDLEQTKAVLNHLPEDPDWKKLNFGFNAIAESADRSDGERYVVYFSSPEANEGG